MTQNAINNTASILAVDNLTLDGNTLSSTDTNGNIVLAPDGSGTVSVTTAPIVPSGDRADSLGSATNSWDNVYCDGLSFDDGSNIMGAYEEGTWTPTLTFGGGSTGLTYTTQSGSYTRIGRMVFLEFLIQLSAKGSSTGTAVIGGLPFNVGAKDQVTAIGGFGNFDIDASYVTPGMRADSAASTLTLVQSGDNNAFIVADETNFGASTFLSSTVNYFA